MSNTHDVVDWSKKLSSRNKYKPSASKGLFPLEQIPGMISLLAGKPNPTTFPFSAITVSVKPIIPGDKVENLVIDSTDLENGLQYGPTAGLTPLVSWITDLTIKRHNRVNDGSWRNTIGSGSQDLINKAFIALIEEGDSILLETPVYSGTLGLLTPEPATLIEVPTDTQGLNPEGLEEILSSWSTKRPNQRFPKILYTIPTGSNPTGCSSPLDRKLTILAIARKYDLLIFEDDAYHFIYYGEGVQAPSYFELEARDGGNVGRVVRFDSFSKILSSGMRLGFMTAAKPLADMVDLHTSNTNLQPSSTTQAIVLALLQHWGYDGFIEHTRRVAAFYKSKRDMFESAAHKHLDGLATWVSPDCGMFLYLRLNLSSNPLAPAGDSQDLISNAAVKKGILAVPGTAFLPSGGKSEFVRVSFSLTSEADADEAMKRLKECIEEKRLEV